MRRGVPFLLAAVLLFLLSGVVFAQTGQTGNLAGTVKDPTGAVLPGVTIEALSQEKGTTRSTTTDTGGKFRLQAMPIGQYTITASLSGFDRYPWVSTAYLLCSTISVPIFAKLSDIYGRKWFLLGGSA